MHKVAEGDLHKVTPVGFRLRQCHSASVLVTTGILLPFDFCSCSFRYIFVSLFLSWKNYVLGIRMLKQLMIYVELSRVDLLKNGCAVARI